MRSIENIYVLWMGCEGRWRLATAEGGTDNGAIQFFPFVVAEL